MAIDNLQRHNDHFLYKHVHLNLSLYNTSRTHQYPTNTTPQDTPGQVKQGQTRSNKVALMKRPPAARLTLEVCISWAGLESWPFKLKGAILCMTEGSSTTTGTSTSLGHRYILRGPRIAEILGKMWEVWPGYGGGGGVRVAPCGVWLPSSCSLHYNDVFLYSCYFSVLYTFPNSCGGLKWRTST